MGAVAPLPAGFAPLQTRAAFVHGCGGFLLHEQLPILAMRVGAEPLNSVQIAHGGLLATLADCAFGAVLWRQLGGATPPITVNLNVDYLGAVRAGDWLEAHVEVDKVGGSFINASCRLKVGERLVLRANGIFTRWKSAPQPAA
ncbi:PaaI family thioesterase [Pseudomonas sp. UL073]|uniref:PaaI family thioesterase n=1 Tax=Zestomonas insulae TaxID=2809017 RepID=A0ABS2IH88_9GAMM|nr:PaaI family thioesterase [Pseudomonas insulae]MBM7061295.1 PaaI family thioesterase [Pseudomonas insulae]